MIKRRRRSSINEALGNRIAVRSLRHIGYGAYKIPDVMGSHFTDKKPYDIVASSLKGRSIAIEGKLMKKWGRFDWKVFQSQQIVELDANCLKREGRSFVFIYVIITEGNKRMHRLCVLDWKKYHKQIKGKGISIDQMRSQKVGKWYDLTKDKFDKDIYNIKGFMK